MLQTAHHKPLLGALVGQLLGTDRPPPPPRLSEKRRTRMEKILVLMLRRGNVQLGRLAHACDVSNATAYEDASALLKAGLLSSWLVQAGTIKTRWYGLTTAGIKRAKGLKEMEA